MKNKTFKILFNTRSENIKCLGINKIRDIYDLYLKTTNTVQRNQRPK